MGQCHELININKKECIRFTKIHTGCKKRELSGTIVASNIITYYLLSNSGDRIAFIHDYTDTFHLFGETYNYDDFKDYKDVEEEVIELLIQNEILTNQGKIWIDKEDNLYVHDLVNIWDPKAGKDKA